MHIENQSSTENGLC